ncbi:MAG: hypothetical protein IKH28_14565 [Lachnospiraceae bacterium]|nr:hypothetical protein [Lachnospiraceae bacterium]
MMFFFGLIMFLCLVPTTWIYFFQIYPAKWKEKKLVFGVKNRSEFQEGETAQQVEALVKKHHTQALGIAIVVTILSALFLLLKGVTVQTAIWTIFIMIALVALVVPYYFGNREMKALKRSLGIKSEAGVTYTDLSNASAVHALRPANVCIPTLLSFGVVIFALMVDLKVIPFGNNWFVGVFMLTGMAAMFFAIAVLVCVLAVILDRVKNEVVSADSAINANYNRAKKKNMADMFVIFLWVNFVFMVLWMVSFYFITEELLVMIALAVYMILLLSAVALFVVREKKIEARYEKEMTMLEDDDDLWIAGMIYCNPNDKRLNVEKRVGVGGTINLAHPVGKLVYVAAALAIVATIVAVVFLGMMESTPLKVYVKDGKVICHQLWDEYVIDVNDIQEFSKGDNLSELHMARIAGVGMPNMLKGKFFVNEDSGCSVFLWRANENYIMIRTADRAYYFNSTSEDETLEAARSIESALSSR